MFIAYLTGVASYAFFPITLDHDFIDVMRRNTTLERGINLVPFRDLAGGGSGTRQLAGNLLLGVPFGFGLPFVIRRPNRGLLAWGVGFAASIELIQLAMNMLYGFPYRVVDVNDFLLNSLGVILGLAAFRLTAAMYHDWPLPTRPTASHICTGSFLDSTSCVWPDTAPDLASSSGRRTADQRELNVCPNHAPISHPGS